MTQDGDEKTEDNAPVSLLPAGNKEVSPADDAQAADTGAPQPLFSIPDEADKETQPTELLPENRSAMSKRNKTNHRLCGRQDNR